MSSSHQEQDVTERYKNIKRIREGDEILTIENDNMLTLGKGKDELNAIIIIPKLKRELPMTTSH